MTNKVKVDYLINKDLNKLVFIGELCNLRGNPWNRERVREWLKKSGGSLSDDERSLLKKFEKSFLKVNYPYIEALFMAGGKKLRYQLIKELGVNNYQVFEKAMEELEVRFEILWKTEENRLKHVRQELKKKRRKIEKICVIIGDLCGRCRNKQELPIHLVISSKQKDDIVGWYSSMGNNIDLVAECSGMNFHSTNFLLLVILHEIFHVFIRDSRIKFSIREISERNAKFLEGIVPYLPPEKIVEELLISTFAPEGIFAEKFFDAPVENPRLNIKRKKVNLVLLRRHCAYEIKKFAKEYLSKKKIIDKQYLVLVIEEIKRIVLV